jgi:glucokinase
MSQTNYTIGIDVGGTSIKAVLAKNFEILAQEQIETPKNIDDFLAEIKKLYERLSADHEIDFVGITLPGLVDYKKETAIYCPNISYLENVRADEFGLPIAVKIANDADCALMYEMSYLDDHQSAAILTLGTGIGGAFCIAGLPPTKFNLSGEVGHVKFGCLPANCSDKNLCSLETTASAKAIISQAQTTISPEIHSAEEVFNLCRSGNSEATVIVKNFASALALMIANLVNILGVENIILGGKMSLSFDLFSDMVEEQAKQNIFLLEKRKFKIIRAKNPEFGGALGATLL